MRSRLAPVLIAALVLVSCSNDGPKAVDSETNGSTATTAAPIEGAAAIEWSTAKDGLQDGTLQVPIDYENPSGGSFTLHLVRHLATDPSARIGTLLINPGGPGVGGSSFAEAAGQIFNPALLSHFDILGWDPRGTGQSTPAIDCIDDYDTYYASKDITPDDDAERQRNIDLAKQLEEACATKNADILQFVGTNNSARDMDSIRRALGEPKISYFGFSYGSELGATWATLFPDTVRAAVLDGASDPNASFVDSSLAQSKGFEDSLDRFLADCSAREECSFHSDGNAEGAYDALMASLDANPIPSDDGRPKVNLTVATTAAAEAMYDSQLWPVLADALADAAKGDGRGLLDLYDEYYQRNPDGTYPNDLEAFQTIVCMDTSERPTVAEEDAVAPEFAQVAPRIAPGTTGDYFCTFYPETKDPRATITGKGAGPIVVIGTTGDPATPLTDTEAMAKALEEGVLIVVEGNQHTGYTASRCAQDAVDTYLVDLTVPPVGTRCSS